ncbi:MAG TPA: DUF4232 domain-containing protein [Streptosporangiaceae bacterium]|nr:DUF4232 domain-containing protein [Streptosporangiaceae bacterium]
MQLSTLSRRWPGGMAALACAAALTLVTACAATGSPAKPAASTAAASAAAASTAAVSTAAASTPECATSGLVVWMDTAGQAYAGGVSYTLEFTNLSGHACTLYGYPGVWAVTLSGSPIGAPTIGGTIPPATVTVANGATATSTLRIADPANFGTACFLPGQTPVPGRPGKLPTAAGLHVEPPNPRSFTYKVIPFPFKACYSTSAGPVYLSTTPVRS